LQAKTNCLKSKSDIAAVVDGNDHDITVLVAADCSSVEKTILTANV
jgi:hypothetical protein